MKKKLFYAMLLSFFLVFTITGCMEKQAATNDDDTQGKIDNKTNIATNESKVICTNEIERDESTDKREYVLTFNDDKLTYMEVNNSKDYKSDNLIADLYNEAKDAANKIMDEITESIAEVTNSGNMISTDIKIDVEKAGDTLKNQFDIDATNSKNAIVSDLETKNYTCSD